MSTQAKSREARYEQLVNRHKDAVYRQIARVCGNYDDAEDVLVETLLAAYRAMDQVRDEDAIRGWLATIGRRICRRMRSREALLPLMQLDDEAVPVADTEAEDSLERQRLKGCINKAIQGLPDPYREVYVLRELRQMSSREVADRLAITIPNLKSRLHRARKLVREALDSELCESSS